MFQSPFNGSLNVCARKCLKKRATPRKCPARRKPVVVGVFARFAIGEFSITFQARNYRLAYISNAFAPSFLQLSSCLRLLLRLFPRNSICRTLTLLFRLRQKREVKAPSGDGTSEPSRPSGSYPSSDLPTRFTLMLRQCLIFRSFPDPTTVA